MHLRDGHPWTIPITLEVPEERVAEVKQSDLLELIDPTGQRLAELAVEDVYEVDLENDLPKVFGAYDHSHPGAGRELARPTSRVGGSLRLTREPDRQYPEQTLTPLKTRSIFREKGWKTVVGFQTRNPIHRAHEYLQRVGLELAEGILIHPLVGWKKDGEFLPEAIIGAYQKMIDDFYPADRVVLATLETPMRYAGPREAVFHAIIRRNFGCTHFIVGRDHAGVGKSCGRYDAQKLCSQFTDLGIEILALCGPHYCRKCGGIATEKSCAHSPPETMPISGTDIRRILKEGLAPPPEFMRPEISAVLIDLQKRKQLFCGAGT